jgi:hypothetical protein
MNCHRVQYDNQVIKLGYQGKEVVNKVTVYGLWFTYGMVL